jgi:ribonuclease HI
MSQANTIKIYTDGACLQNPGPGGFAALLQYEENANSYEKMIIGGEPHSTNNRMELRAVIEGLRALKEQCVVEVYSDSQYVVKGMNEWIQGWLARNWVNSQKKPVENQDLWKELLEVASLHQVQFFWVKAHAGHPENERVDQAAYEQAQAYSRR